MNKTIKTSSKQGWPAAGSCIGAWVWVLRHVVNIRVSVMISGPRWKICVEIMASSLVPEAY